MLTGWKDITAYVGLSVNSIKKLMLNEGFPVQYLQGKPAITQEMIAKWMENRFKTNSRKTCQ